MSRLNRKVSAMPEEYSPDRTWGALLADITRHKPLPESWRHDMAQMWDRLAEIDRLIKEFARLIP